MPILILDSTTHTPFNMFHINYDVTVEEQNQKAYEEALRRIEECHQKGEEGKELDLGFLGLADLPPEIAKLTSLTDLQLIANQLSTLPPEIGQVSTLQRLHLQDNAMISLPPEIGQLSALYELCLGDNEMTSLPPEIRQLTKLWYLELGKNHLSSLPEEIGQLRALYRIELWENELTSLPAEIGNLTALNRLYLRRNQLTALPSEIGKLSELRMLSLRNNQLTALPLEMQKLHALKELYLHDNPALNLPDDVLGEAWKNEMDDMPKSPASHSRLPFRPASKRTIAPTEQSKVKPQVPTFHRVTRSERTPHQVCPAPCSVPSERDFLSYNFPGPRPPV
jgi:Leucine-rich repeat (LRR) protein